MFIKQVRIIKARTGRNLFFQLRTLKFKITKAYQEQSVKRLISYRKTYGIILFVIFAMTTAAFAQRPTPTPELVLSKGNENLPIAGKTNLYCAGFIQTAPIDTSYELVGADNEADGHIYSQSNLLYIRGGANRGVKVGDMFSVIRPRGRVESRWTKKKNIGFYVQELGMVEIIRVKNDVSIAQVKTSCDNFVFGDILQPIPNRVSPMAEERPPLDIFADPTGKASGKILMAKDARELLSRDQVVYIDLGAEDNVRVGDYLTIYRPLGSGHLFGRVEDESVSARDEGYQSREYRGGKFSNQAGRKKGDKANGKVVTTEGVKDRRPDNLRKILGEMVILNVKEKTATAVIIHTASEIHTGDSVELQ